MAWGTLVSVASPGEVSSQAVSERGRVRVRGLVPGHQVQGWRDRDHEATLPPELGFQFQPPDISHLVCKWDNDLPLLPTPAKSPGSLGHLEGYSPVLNATYILAPIHRGEGRAHGEGQ